VQTFFSVKPNCLSLSDFAIVKTRNSDMQNGHFDKKNLNWSLSMSLPDWWRIENLILHFFFFRFVQYLIWFLLPFSVRLLKVTNDHFEMHNQFFSEMIATTYRSKISYSIDNNLSTLEFGLNTFCLTYWNYLCSSSNFLTFQFELAGQYKVIWNRWLMIIKMLLANNSEYFIQGIDIKI